MKIENRKANFDFEMLKEFEAGLELEGHEVKSLRSGKGSLEGAHVVVRGGEAFMVGSTVPPFQVKNVNESYDAERPRKLLLTKAEIRELANMESKKGLTIVPLSVYNKGRNLKIKIAIAKGKKKFDKRETIKKRDAERDIGREFKEH